MVTSRSRDVYTNRLEKAVLFIQQNLAAPLDLDAVAQAAGFSPYHFHRIFTSLMDENPQDYINRLRLERAANLLVKSPALSITEVALNCGFSSSSAFSRSFRKYFGQTAREYARLFSCPDAPLAWVRARADLQRTHALTLPEIQVQPMPALHLAYFAAYRGYVPSSIQAAWSKMFRRAAEMSWLKPETLLISISFDDPKITPRAKCRFYACMTVPPAVSADAQAGMLDFPPHQAAVCRVHCRQSAIEAVYHAVYDWLPDSGFIMIDLPPYEICLKEPEHGPDGMCDFDLCVPVAVI